MKANEPSRTVRFGPYEADFHTQELRKHGVRIKLAGQPLQVLEFLLARPGQLVTRVELERLLWPGQVFVDSNHGLNAAVNKLRDALSDSAAEPKYIETLPRRGYRFIGPLEADNPQPGVIAGNLLTSLEAAPQQAEDETKKMSPETPAVDTSQGSARHWMIFSSAAALFFCLIGFLVFAGRPSNRVESLEQQRKSADEKFTAAGPVASQRISSEKPAKVLGLHSLPAGNLLTPDNRNEERIALDGAAALQHALTTRKVIWGDGGNAAPQFSPDGKRIAFMSNRKGPWQIWVSEVDGSRPRQVSFTESAGTPRWSPDGTSIAFDAPFDDTTWIFVVRVGQSERAKPIVEGLVPSFSRDGKWIYFSSERTGEWEVWKTSVGNGSQVQVTFSGGFAALESTDGYVYYSKSRYPQPEICRVRIRGGDESCGFQHLRPRTWASWAPTREGIVFAEDLPDGKAGLSLYDPARRQVHDLALLQSAPFWVGASIDGKRAIMNDAAERQISMVENLH